jgi:hypothetical protein
MNVIRPIDLMIREAFAEVTYPGDDHLRGSDEGDEPFLLEREFKGQRAWQALEPVFLDQAPEGYGSALSFFSNEAFRFYLPAYLLADLQNRLERANPLFHLCHGLDNHTSRKPINPARYGKRTWFEEARLRFELFTRQQAAAVVAYLEYKAQQDPYERVKIQQALVNYWRGAASMTASEGLPNPLAHS